MMHILAGTHKRAASAGHEEGRQKGLTCAQTGAKWEVLMCAWSQNCSAYIWVCGPDLTTTELSCWLPCADIEGRLAPGKLAEARCRYTCSNLAICSLKHVARQAA